MKDWTLTIILVFYDVDADADSGLHVNRRKRLLFPIKEVANYQVLAATLRCEAGSLPTTYLGLSLGSTIKLRESGM